MTAGPSALDDRELVAMLIDDPQLLAIADAFVATKRPRARVKPSRRSFRRRIATSTAVAAAAAATVTLLVASPWNRAPGFTEKALAAVGGGPVLHVVVTQPALAGGPVIDLTTGEPITRTARVEVWFDRERNLKKTIETLDGKQLDEELETARGGWSEGGPIITCAWIAAHPVEATRLRVSCNPSGENGTTPRNVPQQPPTLDPALAGFVDHYRSALESGAATIVGRGPFEGRQVIWLRFEANGRTERAAVDASTYKPVAIAIQGADLTLRVVEAEAVPFSSALFKRPPAVDSQTGSTVAGETEVGAKTAAAALGGRLVWLGPSWSGLEFVAATLQKRTIGYGPGREPERADVIRLTYAPRLPDGTPDRHSRVDIYESATCVVTIGWECNARDPSSPNELKLFAWIGLLRRDGLYVSVWNAGETHPTLELARALVSLTT
jgi:hypothetical protein